MDCDPSARKLTFIDIRKTIDELAKVVGWSWFALRKADPTKKCHCATKTTAFGGKPDPSCSRCFGTGLFFTDFFVKAFLWRGAPGVEFATPEGLLSTQTKFAIVRHERPVRTTDFLLALDLYPDTGEIVIPPRVVYVYAVQDAFPVHGDDGRIEFWKLYLESRNISWKAPGDKGPDPGTTFTNELDPGV